MYNNLNLNSFEPRQTSWYAFNFTQEKIQRRIKLRVCKHTSTDSSAFCLYCKKTNCKKYLVTFENLYFTATKEYKQLVTKKHHQCFVFLVCLPDWPADDTPQHKQVSQSVQQSGSLCHYTALTCRLNTKQTLYTWSFTHVLIKTPPVMKRTAAASRKSIYGLVSKAWLTVKCGVTVAKLEHINQCLAKNRPKDQIPGDRHSHRVTESVTTL